jgi:hypothetical protein
MGLGLMVTRCRKLYCKAGADDIWLKKLSTIAVHRRFKNSRVILLLR